MTRIFAFEYAVPLHDSAAFARLSGDYNPLHVDPIAARRIQFGGTVTHGIHLFLRALDELAARQLLDQQQPATLSATFNTPVLTGATVKVRVTPDNGKFHISADTEAGSAFTAVLELQSADASTPVTDVEFAPAYAQEVPFPPKMTEGNVPLQLSRTRLIELFPALAALRATSWIADVLATTHIIGMRCPGMDSIYSGFRLRRAPPLNGSPKSMHYQVSGLVKRFRLARIEVTGACLAGTLETFFRPRPVAQRSMEDVLSRVSRDAFVGHRALIIGGSRGLGELTAKIAAAGGADVTITYAFGKEDAERVCREIQEFQRACSVRPLDVLNTAAGARPEWISQSHFSHVYFFATPPISKNSGPWSDTLFRKYSEVYVAAFATLVERTLDGRADSTAPVRFLYPSSIFVTQPEAGFAEYAVAKAAGEALCEQLQGRQGAQFFKPRLPRMRTDQTNSLIDVGALDPFQYLFEVIRALHLTA